MGSVAAQDSYRYVPAEDDSSGLRPSLLAVRRYWVLAVAVFLLIVGAGGWYVLNIPSSYAAGAVVAFEPRASATTGGDLASLLAERYPEVVASDVSVETAAEASGATTGEVASGLSATIQPSTLNLILQVRLPSNDQAVSAAESIYTTVMKSNETDPTLRAVTVSSPTAWGPVGISKKLLLGAIIFVAAVLGFVAALVADGFSRNPVSGSTPSAERS
ncbi:MAG: hypothetical protein QG597_1808 [Actinomycetota bacterium]|nr:hypothetical protein [Actinomycetota bacterium]